CVCLSFFSSSIPLLPLSLLFPYTTLFRSPGLAGWFSSDKNKQFDMEHELTPAPDACAFQIGTPNMLSAAPLLGALELFQEAGIERIRKKSLELTDYMMDLLEHEVMNKVDD